MKSLLEEAFRSHVRNRPNKILFGIYQPDGTNLAITFERFAEDVSAVMRNQSGADQGALHFITGTTSYHAIVMYVAAIFGKQYPAFMSPLTTRADPEVYGREIKALVQRFKPSRLSGF